MATAHKGFSLTIVVCAGLCGASVQSASLSPRQGSGQAPRQSSGQAGEHTAKAKAKAQAQAPTFGIGHTPAPDRLKRIDIDVTPDGAGLLPGSGTAAKGKDVYTRRCETCHGPTGTEGPQDTLTGGKGSLATSKPLKTVGSYWPYATTLWDYINRAMPFDHPSTLTPDEVYSAAAYVLFLNGIVGEQDVLDQTTLPKVQMPNRNGFVADPRPDTPLKKK